MSGGDRIFASFLLDFFVAPPISHYPSPALSLLAMSMRVSSSGSRAHQPSVPSGLRRDICTTSKKRAASPSFCQDNKRQRLEENLKFLSAGSFQGFAPQGPWQSHTIYGNSKEYPIIVEAEDDEWVHDWSSDDSDYIQDVIRRTMGRDSTQIGSLSSAKALANPISVGAEYGEWVHDWSSDDSDYVRDVIRRTMGRNSSRIDNLSNANSHVEKGPVPDQVTAIRNVQCCALHATLVEPPTRCMPGSLAESASNRPSNKKFDVKFSSESLSAAPPARCPPPPAFAAPPTWPAGRAHHWYQPCNSKGTATAGPSTWYRDRPPSQLLRPLESRINPFTSHSLPKFPGSASGYAGGYGELRLGPPGPPQALHYLNVQPQTFREGRQNNCSSSADILRHGEREACAMHSE
ncbi:hypothetical protein CVT26_011998 [Gymnopilus dilepis]|uniref:Uncharacterized protein n=1 Tax=Gymnopilus dilepis TaxID=231916 RepID=A0A409YHK7_9AGAR|nr:hypothetical protein CVT26_011998 [Gymnopilus dilepis]